MEEVPGPRPRHFVDHAFEQGDEIRRPPISGHHAGLAVDVETIGGRPHRFHHRDRIGRAAQREPDERQRHRQRGREIERERRRHRSVERHAWRWTERVEEQ
jgi:hypothetical protein